MPTRIRRRGWPPAATVALIAVMFIAGWWLEPYFLVSDGWQRPLGRLSTGNYAVRRVIDGDTIILVNGDLRVRLQGIDTPETVDPNKPVERWGKEATDYTRQFMADADWSVQLEINGEPVDRYGRHLAFVWYDGRLLNEELVLQGLARAKTTFDFSLALKNRLRQAQSKAQAAKRGIWSGER